MLLAWLLVLAQDITCRQQIPVLTPDKCPVSHADGRCCLAQTPAERQAEAEVQSPVRMTLSVSDYRLQHMHVCSRQV